MRPFIGMFDGALRHTECKFCRSFVNVSAVGFWLVVIWWIVR